MNLQRLKGWAFDLDGTIWWGRQPGPGAPELVAALRGGGQRVLFLTNSSSARAVQIAAKLSGMGMETGPQDVVTAVDAAGEYLRNRYGSLRVLASGMASMADALAEAGHTIADDPDEAEAVLIGRSTQWTYADLTAACRAVDRGIPFLALNRDLRIPTDNGQYLPGCGAIAAAITAVTGRSPEVVGKPGALLFETALQRMGTAAEESVMVGDSLESDIAGARGAGLWSVLVGTAADPQHQAEGWACERPGPHLQVENLTELLQLWERSRQSA